MGTLIAVLVKTPLSAFPIAFSYQRMCGVFVDTPKSEIAFISAYIHYREGRGLEAFVSHGDRGATRDTIYVGGC